MSIHFDIDKCIHLPVTSGVPDRDVTMIPAMNQYMHGASSYPSTYPFFPLYYSGILFWPHDGPSVSIYGMLQTTALAIPAVLIVLIASAALAAPDHVEVIDLPRPIPIEEFCERYKVSLMDQAKLIKLEVELGD